VAYRAQNAPHPDQNVVCRELYVRIEKRAKRVSVAYRAQNAPHPDQITLLASNVAVTRVRKQSHQAHFSGENDSKLGKSGQKKIATKIIGP
jgi:hypothetical protein